MRRVFAELILAIALMAGSLALTGWWIRVTMLDPHRTEKVAATVFESPEVRAAVADAIAGQVATATGQDKATVEQAINTAIVDAPDASFLTKLVTDVHSAAIGAGSNKITLDAQTLTPLVGPDVAAQVAGQTGGASFTVPRVSQLNDVRTRLDGWLAGLVAVSATGIAAAFVLHPRRPMVFRRLGWWLLGLSLWQLILTWVIPAKVVPAITSNPWALLAARVAVASAEQVRFALVGLAVAGVASFVAAAAWSAATVNRDRWSGGGGNPSAPQDPGRANAAWSAWAASNAAATRRRQDAAPVTDPSVKVRFGSGHRRDSDRDL